MAKKNPLQSALDQKQAIPVQQAMVPGRYTDLYDKGHKQTSRAGRVLIGGHFSPEVQTELKIIAATERTTVQALLAEGLDLVFSRRGKPQIAGLPPNVLSTDE